MNARLDDVKDSWIFNAIIWVSMAGLLVALLKLASMNVAPYIWFIKNFGQETNQMWLDYVPVFGAIHKGFVSTIQGIAGVLLWGLVQVLQTLWILVGLDRKAHSNALKEARAARVSNPDQQSSYERKMTRRAQSIPFFFVKWSGILALGAYAFDGVLGLSIFPPAANFQTFLFALGSGMTSQIDGQNVLSLLVMMFSFEVLLIPSVVVFQWYWHRQQEG